MIDVKPLESMRAELVVLVVRLRRDVSDPPFLTPSSAVSGWRTALLQVEQTHLPYIDQQLVAARAGSADAGQNAAKRIELASELVEAVIGYVGATTLKARARSLGNDLGKAAGEVVNTVGEGVLAGGVGLVEGALTGSGVGTLFLLLSAAAVVYLVVRR